MAESQATPPKRSPRGRAKPIVDRRAETAPLNEIDRQQAMSSSEQNRHIVQVHSLQREKADVDLLVQAILIIAGEGTTPSDVDDAALT